MHHTQVLRHLLVRAGGVMDQHYSGEKHAYSEHMARIQYIPFSPSEQIADWARHGRQASKQAPLVWSK